MSTMGIHRFAEIVNVSTSVEAARAGGRVSPRPPLEERYRPPLYPTANAYQKQREHRYGRYLRNLNQIHLVHFFSP